ncbi:MAG TPA: nucleoside hydrolase [Bryobacteraceae bacterium]|nr:nucleoside hydrolase [Bryobacteraceae bacterium]
MTGKLRPILIDTDTASDDAVALIMALRSRDVEVQAITVVAGNVPLEQGSRNALYTAELCASDVPVFAGAAAPLLRNLQTADWFHGHDGLGDHGYAPSKKSLESGHAVDAIIRVVKQTPGIEIITLGPLTNLALALTREPAVVANVSRCVVMGGAPCCEGNVTPAAEFNIWVDPEAARTVFQSGLPIEMIGWQLCRGPAAVNTEDIDKLNKLANSFADFAVRCNSVAMEAYRRQTGEIGISLPDPVAMSILLDPSLCLDSSQHFVEIETQSELTRGMTVVDRLNVAGDPRNREVWSEALKQGTRASICWQLDIPRWKALLFDALST